MALLSTEERAKLPDSSFAYIDAKGVRHLPLPDAAHVRDALARFSETTFDSDGDKAAARSKLLAAAKRLGVSVSADFAADLPPGDVNFTVDFSDADTREEEDDIILTGNLFQCGDYPDKAFSLTPAEMWHTINAFVAERPMDFEHFQSKFGDDDFTLDLSGQFGHIRKIWSSPEQPDWLKAEVAKPKWLNQLMPENRVSASFSRKPGKPLMGAAWTDHPRVEGAELVAAFASKHSTPSGQMAMQTLHDAAARAGAVCSRPAAMASRHESKAVQQVHDIAAEHGAQCEDSSQGTSAMYSQDAGQAEHTDTSPRRTVMKILDFLRSIGAEKGVEFSDEEIAAEFGGPALEKVNTLEQALAAERQKLASLEKAHADQVARLESDRVEDAAAAFSLAQVEAKRITPEGAPAVVALYTRIAQSDSTASFAEGEQSSLAILNEVFAALPDAALFTSGQVPAGTQILDSQETTPVPGAEPTEVSVERRKELLAMTPAGQIALKTL